MQYALRSGHRTTASPRAAGAVCPACLGPVRARCGTRVVWHWAHHARPHCDPWWETETEWHRVWKSRFPEPWREYVQHDAATGEKHIADVRTDSGLVLEFQNSPITPAELASREAFYGAMVWVVNGAAFQRSFHVLEPLPDPDSAFASDLRFFPQRIDYQGRLFWRLSENPNARLGDLVTIHATDEIADEILENYLGHHLFHWQHPRTVWFHATKPVFLDFGDEDLWLLTTHDDRGLPAVQCHSREEFVAQHGGT